MTLSEEDEDFVQRALHAAETGNAYHWPTVAGYLADEVARLRSLTPPREERGPWESAVSDEVATLRADQDDKSARLAMLEQQVMAVREEETVIRCPLCGWDGFDVDFVEAARKHEDWYFDAGGSMPEIVAIKNTMLAALTKLIEAEESK